MDQFIVKWYVCRTYRCPENMRQKHWRYPVNDQGFAMTQIPCCGECGQMMAEGKG